MLFHCFRWLRYPTAISEKLGLALAKALGEDDQLHQRIHDRLIAEMPQSAAEELRSLSAAMAPPKATGPESASNTSPKEAPMSAPPARLAPGEVAPGLRLRFDRGRHPRIELSGVRANDALYRALKDWLAQTQSGTQR